LGLAVPEQVFPFAIVVIFPVFWIGISFILSRVGGWGALAERYPDLGQADVPEAQTFRWRSVGLGAVNYGSCVTLRICDSGIGLSVMLPFRLGHPPLFIPWNELHSITLPSFLWVRKFKAYVGLPVVGSLVLPGWVADYYPHPIDGQ
jgi:hypothetical protein